MSVETDETNILEPLRGYDWECAFSACAGSPQRWCGWSEVPEWHPPRNEKASPVTRPDVVAIDGISEGENDGPDWLLVAQLKDGRWLFLTAGCDYTGWDCQSSGRSYVAHSKEELMGAVDTEARERMYPNG